MSENGEDEDYSALLARSSKTRKLLDEELHPRYRALQKRFFKLTGIDGKRFKEAVDLRYYRGGYPRPLSPPRDEELVDKVCYMLALDTLLEGSRLTTLFQERGFRFVAEPNGFLAEGLTKAKAHQSQLNQYVSEALDLQREICQRANSIKIDDADVAEIDHEIKKSPFVRAVSFGARRLRFGLDGLRKTLAKEKERHDELQEAIAPLTSELEEA
jgi:hypothetical protein